MPPFDFPVSDALVRSGPILEGAQPIRKSEHKGADFSCPISPHLAKLNAERDVTTSGMFWCTDVLYSSTLRD